MDKVKTANIWEDMDGDTALEKMLNAYLTVRFVTCISVPPDECLSEAKKIIEMVRAYGSCSDSGAAWDAGLAEAEKILGCK